MFVMADFKTAFFSLKFSGCQKKTPRKWQNGHPSFKIFFFLLEVCHCVSIDFYYHALIFRIDCLSCLQLHQGGVELRVHKVSVLARICG